MPHIPGGIVKSFELWKAAKRTRVAVLCALLIGGGLAVARAGFPSASHINLKLADANEGPSRVTMAPAAKKAMPAVVKIAVLKVVKPAGMQVPDGMENDPMFRQFFGNRMQPQRPHREGGLGSGVIVSPDGYILTNNHVVDDATDVTVTLADRREFKGRVIGKDAKIDLAVVKIEASNLPAITVGNNAKMEIGDWIVFIRGHNLAPLFLAIEEHTLARLRAYPGLEQDREHQSDTFAVEVRFVKPPPGVGADKRRGQIELELGG